ncbi:Gfo/Idh/MocA family protein [Sinomonas sp. P47F7]|uniref:Gfo/Idh/MocA family protein n=1 Tax=Sinomonas sp. P47F7 TaxID=3410987 RepID=UPI003BF540F7
MTAMPGNTERPLRFAVVGCGQIGKAHAHALKELAPRAELAAVVDNVPGRAAALADEHGVLALTSLEEALARQDIDVVTLGTPSGLHADQAVAALDSDKHVIVEKPLDVTMEAAQRVLQAEKRSGRTAMVVSQMRYLPASGVVREAAESGAFGKLTSGSATMAWWRSQEYYDSGDWRGTWELDGGGALMNQGIHVIDLFRWFFGDPVEVYAWAQCAAHQRIEVEDTAVAVVRFANGALGTIHGTTAAYPGVNRRIQVHGDRGSAIIDEGVLTYYHAASGDAPDLPYGAEGDGNQAASLIHEADRFLTSHARQFNDFIDAIDHGRPPLVTVTEAAKTLALIRAIYESAQLGQPVKVTAVGH